MYIVFVCIYVVKYASAYSQLSIIKLSINVHKVEAQNIGQRVEHTYQHASRQTHTHTQTLTRTHEQCAAFFFTFLRCQSRRKMSFMFYAVIAINVIVIVIVILLFAFSISHFSEFSKHRVLRSMLNRTHSPHAGFYAKYLILIVVVFVALK